MPDGGSALRREGEPLPTFEVWFKTMPNVTKFYLTFSFLTGLLCAFDVLNPLQLYLNADLILGKMELWRLMSNLIYFGTIAQPVNYLFHSYFMYTYLRDLEENVFERKSDLVYLFIFAAAIMEVREHPFRRSLTMLFSLQLLHRPYVLRIRMPQAFALLADPTIHFLSPAMLFLVVTVWSRKTTEESVTWFAVLNFGPKRLPWVMLVVSLVLNNNPVINVMGIVVGLIYSALSGTWLLGTPIVLKAAAGEHYD